MSNDITIIPEGRPVAQSPAITLIQSALAAGHSPEHLRELLAVRREWEADEARKAYFAAITDFQGRCPIIEKADKAYDKMYARMDRIWSTIRPLMSELGLSVSWQIAELKDGMCHVEGLLAHRAGHSQRLVFDCPLPAIIKTKSGGDAQNAAQQMGSATTYAKRYATCAALGIQTGDDTDDDGHKAGTVFITHDQAQEIAKLVDACRGLADFKEPVFWQFAGASCAQEIAANRHEQVKAMLQKKLKGGV